MYTLKDKVADGLSSLFSDSPNHSSPSDPPQASLYSDFRRIEIFVFNFSKITPSASLGGSKSNDHGSHLKTIQSHPVGWKCRTYELQDESLDSCGDHELTNKNKNIQIVHEVSKKISKDKDKQTISPWGEDKDRTSKRNSNDSEEFQDAQVQRSPVKPPLNLSDESVFITPDLYEVLLSSLPNIVKGCRWMLLYSTLKHGISLRTLIRKSADLPGPCLLITGDRKGAVFGGMLECPLNPTPKRKYKEQTRHLCSLPYMVNLCYLDQLALILCRTRTNLNSLSGSSGPCETFGNLCLAHDRDFELNNVELWGFTHASPYLNRKQLWQV